MAESNNHQYLMAVDQSGFVHMLNTGNLDGGVNPINEIYYSPYIFNRVPGMVSKGGKIDLFKYQRNFKGPENKLIMDL